MNPRGEKERGRAEVADGEVKYQLEREQSALLAHEEGDDDECGAQQ